MEKTHINYLELPAQDLKVTKAFYSDCFGWTFTDYGPKYTAFSDSGVEGGFFFTEAPIINGALVVLYHKNLLFIQEKIKKSGGHIHKEIFSFPGGKRFHFLDPSGNEMAVWSDS
jgi:predicted enzyme related to lactoylglutathione lyase